jgi:hypothetical protein
MTTQTAASASSAVAVLTADAKTEPALAALETATAKLSSGSEDPKKKGMAKTC